MKTMLTILLMTMLIGCGDNLPMQAEKDEGETCATNDECQTGYCNHAFSACMSKDLNRANGEACRFDWDCGTFYCAVFDSANPPRGLASMCSELQAEGTVCTRNSQCGSGHCVATAPDHRICS